MTIVVSPVNPLQVWKIEICLCMCIWYITLNLMKLIHLSNIYLVLNLYFLLACDLDTEPAWCSGYIATSEDCYVYGKDCCWTCGQYLSFDLSAGISICVAISIFI